MNMKYLGKIGKSIYVSFCDFTVTLIYNTLECKHLV